MSSSSPLVTKAASSAMVKYQQDKRKLMRKASLRRLAEVARPEAPTITLGILALIVNSVTNLSFPWLIGSALDNADSEAIESLVVRSAGVFAIGAVASWLRVYCLGTATENIANRLRTLLFESLLGQDMEFYEKTQLGEIATLMEKDINAAAELLTEKLSQCLRNLNSSLNGSFMLFRASPQLCGVALSTVPFIGVGAMLLSKVSRGLANQLRDSQSQVLSYSMERVRNVTTVRLNNREAYELTTFEDLLSKDKQLAHKRFQSYGSFMSFVSLSTNAALVAVLRAGGNLISAGRMTAGSLVSFAIQASFVGLGFSGLSTLYSDYVNALDSATRIFEVIDGCHEHKKFKHTNNNNKLLTNNNNDNNNTINTSNNGNNSHNSFIRLENVSFGYKSRDDFVLDNVSMFIEPNTITCFVGKSGVGKSTLASLLCGLYHPNTGSIHYGSEDDNNVVSCAEAIDSDIGSDIFDMFGVVEQCMNTLFVGSIAKNIEYGKQGASQSEIETAAKSANAHNFISEFPQKYETDVGVNRFMLSGGQTARIALARALIKQPRYLLLDEPTSALDDISEHELIEPLIKLRETTTIIMFTHSDTLKSIADVVYNIDCGQIHEIARKSN